MGLTMGTRGAEGASPDAALAERANRMSEFTRARVAAAVRSASGEEVARSEAAEARRVDRHASVDSAMAILRGVEQGGKTLAPSHTRPNRRDRGDAGRDCTPPPRNCITTFVTV